METLSFKFFNKLCGDTPATPYLPTSEEPAKDKSGHKSTMSGKELELRVKTVAEQLGLSVYPRFPMGHRIWGARREVDLVVSQNAGGRVKRLGIECKYQATSGSAEEKIIAAINDIAAWPIPGLVVIDGEGFRENMRHHVLSSGKAVTFEDLPLWLKLFFEMEI